MKFQFNRTTLISLCLSTLCMLLTTTSWALNADDLGKTKVVEAYVDGLVKPLMIKEHSPSGVFVLMKDGQIILSKGYGWQDVDKRIPVDATSTLMRPGSISKLFTWIAVMQLVEKNKLDLDADINKYLKTFKIKDTYPGQPVTLRNCLTHTAGFEESFLGHLILNKNDQIISLAAALKKYQPERIYAPGTQAAYSNYATSLAGLVVANVSGMSYEDYIQKNIFEPLGMRNSTFKEPLPDNLNQHMAIAYQYANGSYIAEPFELITNFTPAGALTSTAEDMLKFGSALLNGGSLNGVPIISTETLMEMNKIQFNYDGRLNGHGLGFIHYPWGNTDTFGHDGATNAFFSHLGVTPSKNMVIFSSFTGPGGSKINRTLSESIYAEFMPIAPFFDIPPKEFNSYASKYSGSYIPSRHNLSTIEKVFSLLTQQKISPDGRGGLLIGDNRYIEIDKNLFREVSTGQLAAFKENKQGKIIGYALNGLSMFPSIKIQSLFFLKAFNFFFLVLSIVVFVFVFLRFLYQRRLIKDLPTKEKIAFRAALIASLSHLWVVLFGLITMMSVGSQLVEHIPTMLKFWLVFPIIASLASIFLLYQNLEVWKEALFSTFWARLRYTFITFCALFMSWFYFYWNILGFQYN